MLSGCFGHLQGLSVSVLPLVHGEWITVKALLLRLTNSQNISRYPAPKEGPVCEVPHHTGTGQEAPIPPHSSVVVATLLVGAL